MKKADFLPQMWYNCLVKANNPWGGKSAMKTIPQNDYFDNAISECSGKFIKRFKVNGLLRQAGATKSKGIPVYRVFAFLMGLVFNGTNLFTLLATSSEKMSFGKDVIYRFLKKASINWNRFILLLSISIIPEIDKLTSEDRRTAIIFDDTPYYRDRSKHVEMLSRFKDTSENRYYNGFNMLNMGWSDGVTYLPLDYRILANAEGKQLICDSKAPVDNRTLATKRRNDARRDKPSLLLDMLKSIKGTAAEAKYVIFDSWFSSPSSILSVRKLGYHVVTRLANNNNYRYFYQGSVLPISRIFTMHKKRRGRSRYLLSVLVDVRHNDFVDVAPAKIVFIRDRAKHGKWIALLSTDLSLNEEEIIALYGKRWDIEPFHKVIKSILCLETEFQFRSFDAIVAHAAIVLARYLMLAVENRENKDWRSVNEGFHRLCAELDDISFANAFNMILAALKKCFSEYLHMTFDMLNAAVEFFISMLPVFIKDKIKLLMCES
jgi:predicted phosphatase